MKTCSKCGVPKPLSQFHRKGEQRRRADCRACTSSMRASWKSGQWERFFSLTWHNINQRTVNGSAPRWEHKPCARYLSRGIELRLTRGEYEKWCKSKATIIETLYAMELQPSIDRIDSDGHYELGNIRVVPLLFNSPWLQPRV